MKRKKWMLCGSLALLTGCTQGKGSTPVTQCPVKSTTAQNPFTVQGKVIIEGLGGGDTGQSGDSGSTGNAGNTENKNYRQLDPNDYSKITNPARASTLAVGSELTVLVKEKCSKGGEISNAVRTGQAKAVGAPTKSGVRAYSWVAPRDMERKELEKLADDDACVVGLSSLHRATIDADVPPPVTDESGTDVDPLESQQGHLKMIEAASGWDKVYANQDAEANPVVVAVIDTGIDLKHEDLKPNLWVNKDEIPGNNIDDDKNGYVDDVYGYNFANDTGSPQARSTWAGYQHGTHVSGLAAARAGNSVGGSGVAGTGARIMSLNVFGSSSGSSSTDIVNAIHYAADNGASVINMSIGGVGRNAAYEAAIAYAVNKGVTVLAAAGNERREVGNDYFMSPGAYGQQFPGMMAVASVDAGDESLSTYSNFSPTYVEIAAPGSENSADRVGLLSTWPGGKYSRIQGTSMSSPVAAGGAALAISMLRSRGYNPTPEQIEWVMTESGRSIPALESKVRGGRVLNIRAMAELIESKFPIGGTLTGIPGESSPAKPPPSNEESATGGSTGGSTGC